MIIKIKNIILLTICLLLTYSIYIYSDNINLYNLKSIEINGNSFINNNEINDTL